MSAAGACAGCVEEKYIPGAAVGSWGRHQRAAEAQPGGLLASLAWQARPRAADQQEQGRRHLRRCCKLVSDLQRGQTRSGSVRSSTPLRSIRSAVVLMPEQRPLPSRVKCTCEHGALLTWQRNGRCVVRGGASDVLE